MASVQEPEVQFAQRLASNEKPVRTKAIKKLRKYIHVRSQKAADVFTPEELLKLWKGLFYCLWMQDKPLLQEQLSHQISSLIHSFQDVDGQLLYVQSFLQTFKREWTGIDRLRMDKFFQLIRFMFRETFQVLKKTNWDSSAVSRFLELLSAQVLQSGGEAPCGLQFHILDVYMSELAVVAADELTADQNLAFIQPFCKTAARTKDRTLLGAICRSIFNTITEQAPFAIEDLMKELRAAANSDSGQSSEEEDGQTDKRGRTTCGDVKQPQMNGRNSKDDDDEEEDEDEPLDLDQSAGDEDVAPVLQFDYGALADRLFELASRSSTPTHNREKLYGIVKVLRNLSEGVFPQEEYPEEVSTDEDDDMYCSRKWMKRRRCTSEEEEAPDTKKSKKKKKDSLTPKEESDPVEESSDLPVNHEKKKRKSRKKKKKGVEEGGSEQMKPQNSAVKTTTEEEPSDRFPGEEAPELQDGTNASSMTDDAPSEKTLAQANSAGEHRPQTPGKKRKKRNVNRGAPNVDVSSVTEETADVDTAEASMVEAAPTPAKKKKSQVETPQLEEEQKITLVVAEKKKKKKKKPLATTVGADGETEAAPEDQSEGSTSGKKKKKKKIPVVFEFEADELQMFSNGDAEETAKAPVRGGSPPQSGKKAQKKKKKTEADFVTFQMSTAVPTPLFCRTKGGASRKPQTPKSDSKKVTFGLKNNKTAEFRKTDRSLLVSPDGSSRVPFDPQQKPKFSVLKSPATPRVRKRKCVGTPRRTPKSRPTAADFF